MIRRAEKVLTQNTQKCNMPIAALTFDDNSHKMYANYLSTFTQTHENLHKIKKKRFNFQKTITESV